MESQRKIVELEDRKVIKGLRSLHQKVKIWWKNEVNGGIIFESTKFDDRRMWHAFIRKKLRNKQYKIVSWEIKDCKIRFTLFNSWKRFKKSRLCLEKKTRESFNFNHLRAQLSEEK